jgi:hypothetical protein
MELDDQTVEAIARDLWAFRIPAVWKRDVAFVKRAAPIFAEHLPDPRPTEAEVREALAIDYWHDSSFRRVLRDLGCFRPEPEPSSIMTGPRLSLGEVAPGLVEGLQHLVDEYGQRGVEGVLSQWSPAEPELVTVRRKISAYTDELMRVVTTYH